jgi:hypothetical protein
VYSPTQISKFEEILLNVLNWDCTRTTISEVTHHLVLVLKQSVILNESSDTSDSGKIKELITSLESKQIKSKISIFNQIAILDYKLIKYGPAVLGILSPLFVLKNYGQTGQYDFLKELVPQLSEISSLKDILSEAKEVSRQIFEQQEEPIVRTNSSIEEKSQDMPLEKQYEEDVSKM